MGLPPQDRVQPPGDLLILFPFKRNIERLALYRPLGANPANNLPEMIDEVNTRIHFAHLRNTVRDAEGIFTRAIT